MKNDMERRTLFATELFDPKKRPSFGEQFDEAMAREPNKKSCQDTKSPHDVKGSSLTAALNPDKRTIMLLQLNLPVKWI